MPGKTDLRGSTLYRIGFAIFIAGCLMNAFDAYAGYVHDINYNISSGGGSPEGMYQAMAFVGLSFILILEGVGLMMFKWVKTQIRAATA